MTGKNLTKGLGWVVQDAKDRLFLYEARPTFHQCLARPTSGVDWCHWALGHLNGGDRVPNVINVFNIAALGLLSLPWAEKQPFVLCSKDLPDV